MNTGNNMLMLNFLELVNARLAPAIGKEMTPEELINFAKEAARQVIEENQITDAAAGVESINADQRGLFEDATGAELAKLNVYMKSDKGGSPLVVERAEFVPAHNVNELFTIKESRLDVMADKVETVLKGLRRVRNDALERAAQAAEEIDRLRKADF